MPYVDQGLPFSGSLPASRHTSRLGAVNAAPRAVTQQIRYLAFLKHRGALGATDFEAAAYLGLERSSINARRAPLVREGLIVPGGFRKGPTGIKNVSWRLA